MAAINAVTDLSVEGDIGVVTLNSPPVNALSAAVREGLKGAFDAAIADPAVRAIVLICEGKTFIAGADITEFGKAMTGPSLQDVQAVIENSPKPVVAAIHGTALGGGLEVALVAHYRVAVPSAKAGLPEVNIGLLPGASTLLAALAGTVRTLGAEPGTQPKRVAYLGQFHPAGGLLPLQARDVVMMGRYPRRGLLGRIKRSDREAVAAAMERMDVTDLALQPLRALSGGQQQRVYLAQALAREADFLILDEPTAGLDAGSSERYLQVVQEELARGAAVATATHDISEALLCDQAILLARRVIAYGVPTEVLSADRILDAFGIALRAVPHHGHEDLVAPETPHGHHIEF